MNRRPCRLATAALVGCALIAPLVGCDSATQTKPTIDTSSPLKAPTAPSTQRVETRKAR